MNAASKKPDIRQVSAGLFASQDIISLVPSLFVGQQSLKDAATGARHELDSRALQPIRLLQRPISSEVWLTLACGHGLDGQEAGELIGFLNSIGGLRIRRTWRGRLSLAVYRVRLVIYRFMPELHMWRGQANSSGVLLGVSRAACWILPLAAGTGLALYALGMHGNLAVRAASGCFVIFWVSTAAHELTHVLWVRNHPAAVLQQGLRLGILHQSLSARRDVASALSGPIVGASCALLTGLMFGMLEVSVLFALAQLWSLAPWYGDGKALLQHRKKKGAVWSFLNGASDRESS